MRSKAARSWDRKVSGPPRYTTLPSISRPWARPAMVWFTTALKMLWRDVVFLGALVQKRLDVGFGEHAAPGGDGVERWLCPAMRVQLLGRRCASSVAIWSIKAPVPPAQEPFMRTSIAAGQEQDFRVLAPQLNDHVGVGDIASSQRCGWRTPPAQRGCRKSSARPMPAEPDTHRLARFVWGNFSWMRVSMPEAFSAIWEKCRSYYLVNGLVLPVVDHTFQGGGAHVQTDFHSSFYHPFQSRGSFSCDGWGGCRGCMIANPTKIKSYPGFLTMFLKFSEYKNCCIAVLNHTSIFRRKNQHFRRANLWKLRKKVCARRGFHAATFPVPFWASCAIL